MRGILGKDHARPRRYRGLEAGRPRQRELARPRRDLVAIGIGEMDHGALQRAFNPDAAGRHLLEGDLLGLFGEIAMGNRMRADRGQGIGGERLQLVPGHAELAADRALIDAVARAHGRDFARNVMFARQCPQPAVQPVERRLLAGRRPGIEADREATDFGVDRGGPGDHHLERDPPQPAGSFGEIAGDKGDKRRVELSHQRQRVIAVVAITVVEGERGETP